MNEITEELKKRLNQNNITNETDFRHEMREITH